jgi:hypothetical protein
MRTQDKLKACAAQHYRKIILWISAFTWNLPQIALVVTLGWRATTIIKGAEMTLAQSFLLGMMVAWTPSLVFLGWCLLARNVPEEREAVSATR